MKSIVLLKGLPASGKTTWAKQQLKENPGKYKRINKDELRVMFDDGKWSKHNEKFVLMMRDMLIMNALECSWSVIVDDTNLHPKHEERIRDIAVSLNAKVIVKEFNIDIDEAVKRDLKRPNSVGEHVIRGMYDRYIAPKHTPVEQNMDLPKAYIFDIDGTLAIKSDRSPYDWDRVGEDTINPRVRDMCFNLEQSAYHIIICTGRDGICESETKEWLKKHGFTYSEFHIRPEGNTEKDYIIKERMLKDIVKRYYVLGVFDDRKQVVDMWRKNGIICYDVAGHTF